MAVEGAVRLVAASAAATAACDDVHTGAVEVFSDGIWVPVCAAASGGATSATMAAAVVCRALGFPFAGPAISGMGPGDGVVGASDAYAPASYAYFYASPAESPLGMGVAMAATCTGTETTLADCLLTDAFEVPGEYDSYGYDYGPVPAVAPGPASLQPGCSHNGGGVLTVACTQFPLDGAMLPAMHRPIGQHALEYLFGRETLLYPGASMSVAYAHSGHRRTPPIDAMAIPISEHAVL